MLLMSFILFRFFKTMFSESYNGVDTDAAYYDLALCLAYLCNYEPTLSECALFTHIELPLEAVDTNVCKILSVDRAVETTACTALNPTIVGVTRPRDDYFWGMLEFYRMCKYMANCSLRAVQYDSYSDS